MCVVLSLCEALTLPVHSKSGTVIIRSKPNFCAVMCLNDDSLDPYNDVWEVDRTLSPKSWKSDHIRDLPILGVDNPWVPDGEIYYGDFIEGVVHGVISHQVKYP